MTQTKARLDILLVKKGLTGSRQKAQALITAGKVMVDGKVVDKAGHQFPVDSRINVKGPEHPFVSRGGVKLQAALDHFKIQVRGAVCMDVGASTGGFTDCLLQAGANRVYAVDVGYGQFDWRLRNDKRVILMERTNIRHLAPGSIVEPIDLAVIDTSFISLRLVIPAVIQHMKKRGRIVALIKPQFEVGRSKVGKGGVVKDPSLHEEVVTGLKNFVRQSTNFDWRGVIASPIHGAKGNREFLVLLEDASENCTFPSSPVGSFP